MTAANLFVRDDAAYLLTDSASLDARGRVVCLRPKVIASRVQKVAISSNGTCWATKQGLIASWLMEQADSDAAVEGLPGLVATLRADLDRHYPLEAAKWPPPAFNLFVAIWSKSRRRAEAYIIASHYAGFNPSMGVRADRVYRVEQCICPMGEPSPAVVQCASALVEVDQRVQLRDALSLLDMQRRSCQGPDGQYIIGGIGQLTTVSEAGVSTTVLGQWPDEIGKPIDPAKDPLGAVTAADTRTYAVGR